MLSKLITLVSILSTVGAGTSSGMAPAELLRQAGDSPVHVLMLVANAGIPCGLEVRTSDEGRQEMPSFRFAPAPTVALAALATAFNSRHTGYKATVVDGVFVIRPVEGRAAYLDKLAAISDTRATGVLNALRLVFAGLDASLGRPGGSMGSFLNYDPVTVGAYATITLSAVGQTNEGLLNEIVQQSPRGWIVETTGDSKNPDILRAGFVSDKGTVIYQPIASRRP